MASKPQVSEARPVSPEAADVVYPTPGGAPMVRSGEYTKRMPDGIRHVNRVWAPDVPTVPLDVLRVKLSEWREAQR